MNIIEKIKQDSILYRKKAIQPDADFKTKVIATLLVTLMAEIDAIGKNAGNRPTTEDEATKVVRKFLKGVDEFLAASATVSDEVVEKLRIEREVLSAFLPQVASKEEVEIEIDRVLSGLTQKNQASMGEVMKALKARFGSTLDAKEASALIKQKLA